MSDYRNTASDNGGVHINSGIPNKAFYNVAITMGGYAWGKAGLIWYKTLCEELNQDSDFQSAANSTFKVAGDLYGKNSDEQRAVYKGWTAVGITPVGTVTKSGCRGTIRRIWLSIFWGNNS